MTHGIDASFRLRKQALAARRRRARWRRIFAALGVLAVLSAAATFYLTADYWSFGDENEVLEAVEGSDEVPADASVYVPAIVDLAGDPMWINLARGGSATATKGRTMPRPADLAQPGISPQIEILSDAMLSSSERFMTTIPSTQEDFAFFQAQRTAVAAPRRRSADRSPAFAPKPRPAAAPGEPVANPGAGWGETIDAGEAELPEFEKTAVENNTSVATVTPESERYEMTEDIFVKILSSRSLDSVVLEGHFSETEGQACRRSAEIRVRQGEPGAGFCRCNARLPAAARDRDAVADAGLHLRQEHFVGTLARNAAGVFVSGVDPWVRDDLFNYSGRAG